MSFVLLLVLTLACLPESWQSLTVGPIARNGALSAELTWTGILALALLAAWTSWRTERGLRHHPERTERVLVRYRRWRILLSVLQIIYFGTALTLLGWGRLVQGLGGPDADGVSQMIPGAELLLLAPLLASLLLGWTFLYDADRAVHELLPVGAPCAFWSRRAYVVFHVRHNLALVLVPVGLLVVEKALRRIFAAYQAEWSFQIAVLALMLAAFVALPWLLRLILQLRPLPEGPMRDRLMAAAQRVNFRCSNVLRWGTHGAVANAMVVGILPRLRYVILTDRLVTDLTPEEVEAVFGHEMGHVKHRHMLYYLGFLLVSLAVVAGAWDLAAGYLPSLAWASTNQDLAAIPLAGLLGAYIFVVFGFLSRRCERQADLFGCRTVSCPRADCAGHDPVLALPSGGAALCPTGIRTFMEALEKVARLNGISRNRPGWLQSWQHSTIARRVEFLHRILNEPAQERRFQRALSWVKVALLVALLAVLALLAHLNGWDLAQMRLL